MANGHTELYDGSLRIASIPDCLGLRVVIGYGVPGIEAAVKFSVDGVGFGELVFKDYDATCRVERSALVNEFTCSCRNA